MTRPTLIFSLVALVFLYACADTEADFNDSGVTKDAGVDKQSRDQTPRDLPTTPDGFVLGDPVVYAHTKNKLYKIDPETLKLTLIGPFADGADTPDITDLALDKKGNMIAVSQKNVYSVDNKTGTCTKLSSAKAHYVGLSYVVDNESVDKREYLMGLDKDGAVYEIDPQTGSSKKLGGLGSDPVDTKENLRAAGDIVSIRGFKTLATVERPKSVGENSDWLAELNELTGKATLIGKVGFKGVWGLGFWKHESKNKVFGFTNKGEFILIDVATGKGSLVDKDAQREWWGAGVTTEAPIIK
jgi:hypothetical protein